jgi:hypothetical protein
VCDGDVVSELAKSDTNILDRSATIVEDKANLLGPDGGAREVLHRLATGPRSNKR